MFPDDGITKGELAAYYERVAPVMLPHLRGRPVTMERFHRGIGAKGFFQKNVVEGQPEVARDASRCRRRTASCNYPDRHRRARPAVARQSELHHAARVDVARADAALSGHLRVRSRPARRRRRRRCATRRFCCAICSTELGCPSWVKTSGSKGYHVVVPLDGTRRLRAGGALRARRRPRARRTRPRAPHAGVLQGRSRRPDPHRHRPQRVRRDLRGGVRRAAEADAPVSAPCTWEEVESGRAEPRTFTLRNMADRLDAVGDLWSTLYERPCALPNPP